MGNIFELRMNNLVQIIANYRKDELPFLIDVSHVKKWISQFDSSAQSVVLEETIHILSNWYFGHAKLVSFMREIVEYIRLAYTDFRDVTFWNGQEVGQSQRKLLSLLPEAYPGKTVNIDTVPRKHIVYIDDGLFLIKGLSILPECSIDKGLYPLGYDINPSFGFGSFCANDFNISNTCPVVLWWDADSNWYPLLPRRINSKADFQGITAWEENS